MLVAAGFTPAFKYRQKNFLMVLERGRKARGYEFTLHASSLRRSIAKSHASRGFQTARQFSTTLYIHETHVSPSGALVERSRKQFLKLRENLF
jgi:hypothetical protein